MIKTKFTQQQRPKKYITPSEWNDFLKSIENVQEKAILSLVYQGLFGRNAKHITSLKRADILYEQGVIVTSSDWHDQPRHFHVDEQTLQWLKETEKVDTYIRDRERVPYQQHPEMFRIPVYKMKNKEVRPVLNIRYDHLSDMVKRVTRSYGWYGVGMTVIRDNGLRNAYIDALTKINVTEPFTTDITNDVCVTRWSKQYDLKTETPGIDIAKGLFPYRARILNLQAVATQRQITQS